jgi:hypothetical protein
MDAGAVAEGMNAAALALTVLGSTLVHAIAAVLSIVGRYSAGRHKRDLVSVSLLLIAANQAMLMWYAAWPAMLAISPPVWPLVIMASAAVVIFNGCVLFHSERHRQQSSIVSRKPRKGCQERMALPEVRSHSEIRGCDRRRKALISPTSLIT